MPQDSPPPQNLPQPEDRPSDSPPPLTRSGTARVSFREPISSSYSVDEDEDEEENEEGLREGEENQQEEDEVEGGFGSRLHLQKGIPPQMDLLGKKRLSESTASLLLNKVFDTVGCSILSLMYCCLSTGCFPSCFKRAVVQPFLIPFRLVSKLQFLSKRLEKEITNNVIPF